MLGDSVRAAVDYLGIDSPFPDDYPVYMLVECRDDMDLSESLALALSERTEIASAAVGADARTIRRLWSIREAQSDGIKQLGLPVKFDVSVPLSAVDALITGASQRLRSSRAKDCRLFIFGHLNEGNLHINLVGQGAEDEEFARALFGLVSELGGSVCSEHGVGRAKAQWVSYSRTAEDLGVMLRLKRMFDPLGILNPGVIFEQAELS
jgi:FAD/FMN-containing dehydrogenase